MRRISVYRHHFRKTHFCNPKRCFHQCLEKRNTYFYGMKLSLYVFSFNQFFAQLNICAPMYVHLPKQDICACFFNMRNVECSAHGRLFRISLRPFSVAQPITDLTENLDMMWTDRPLLECEIINVLSLRHFLWFGYSIWGLKVKGQTLWQSAFRFQ